jgi:transposase
MTQHEDGLVGHPDRPTKQQLKDLKMKRLERIVNQGYTLKVAYRMVGVSKRTYARWKKEQSLTDSTKKTAL